MTKVATDGSVGSDRPAVENEDYEVTSDMISVGMAAYAEFDPEREEPEALVFAIIHRAFEIAKRNAATLRALTSRPE